MSPMFLRLAKVRDSNDNLSVIKNINGELFETPAERKQHIVTTFADIYKRPPTYPVNFENLIENFLGEEICNHPLVQASKLTVDEVHCLIGLYLCMNWIKRYARAKQGWLLVLMDLVTSS
jgi:hypothetical protein